MNSHVNAGHLRVLRLGMLAARLASWVRSPAMAGSNYTGAKDP
ncbi:hypothetical protein HMPREF0591_0312 [Mycobacterium parascrofulaceum ATCC BAA-614]|uniref:Uncharacterized protein n=1 Tax=Mycobacterium parascrofulaceum ATCC BAA-614 TaxID=525368 RepID=D5P2C6_9MYCO|nr:hypothetical protein HMPREF0591_0312 [Mycobacterium parascrofulaceum ATCC BAA-614]